MKKSEARFADGTPTLPPLARDTRSLSGRANAQRNKRLAQARQTVLSEQVISSELIVSAPDAAPVIIRNGDSWTTERLDALVESVAAGMHAFGIRGGDRVVLHLSSGPEIAAAYFACFRLGAIAAPLNLRLKQPELEGVLGRLRPALYIGQSSVYSHVAGISPSILPADARFLIDPPESSAAPSWTALHRPPAHAPRDAADPNAVAVLLLTSGTTGQPKFVAHSLRTLTEGADRLAYFALQRGWTVAVALPMVHISGLWTFLGALRLGFCLIVCDAAAPETFLENIETFACEAVFALPVTIAALLSAQRAHPRNMSSLELGITGGDVPPAGQQEAFEATFHRPLRSFWGSTEAIGSFGPGLRPGPLSQPIITSELRLVSDRNEDVPPGETGELLIGGPQVMLGYWEDGALGGLEDGYYRTGDLMHVEPDGQFRFVTRVKDLIVRGGSNISPVEVEQVISGHPAIEEIAVVAAPDPILGERVFALVRLKDGSDGRVLPSVLRWARDRLADYKVPERMFQAVALPRNALGKVDRARLGPMLRQAIDDAAITQRSVKQ